MIIERERERVCKEEGRKKSLRGRRRIFLHFRSKALKKKTVLFFSSTVFSFSFFSRSQARQRSSPLKGRSESPLTPPWGAKRRKRQRRAKTTMAMASIKKAMPSGAVRPRTSTPATPAAAAPLLPSAPPRSCLLHLRLSRSSRSHSSTPPPLLLPPPRATLTTFAITPPGGGDSDSDDDESDSVVECPTIRAALRPRPSPFVMTNYYGGGFASDDDRVALSSIRYASPSSANASCQGFYAAPSSSSLVEEQQKKNKKKGVPSSTTRGEIGGDGLFESGHDAVCIPLPPWAIRAGARETVYFDGRKVTVREKRFFLLLTERKRRTLALNFPPPLSLFLKHTRRPSSPAAASARASTTSSSRSRRSSRGATASRTSSECGTASKASTTRPGNRSS